MSTVSLDNPGLIVKVGQMATITVHTDGAARGNPGPASIAYVIDGLTANQITYKEAIGSTTNNQAEYRALLAALDRLISEAVRDNQIDFFADSELMVKQMLGLYRVKDAGLQLVFAEAKTKVRSLESLGNYFSFTAVRREQNKLADQLANQALDQS